MSKRKADGDDESYTELEVKSYQDLTPTVARKHPHVKTLRIACFVTATSPCGLPANGTKVCRETAQRIPFFLVLFPELEEVHLGGYSVDRDIDPPDDKPFWFTLSKEAVRQERDDKTINVYIGVIFDLINSLCTAYQSGFLSTHVQIHGLFDPVDKFSRYNLLCEEKIARNDDLDDMRDGVSCKICRVICSSIHLDQAMQLKCAEDIEEDDEEGNYIGRLGFLGCQLCLTSQTKFEIISNRPDFYSDLFNKHLLSLLTNDECIKYAWYTCDHQGSPVEAGEFRSAMLRYDTCAEDEIKQFIMLLVNNGDIKSSDIVAVITSNPEAREFMIGDKIFITESTWNSLKDGVDGEDLKRFHVVGTEKYGCFGEDAILSRECWRKDEDIS